MGGINDVHAIETEKVILFQYLETEEAIEQTG